MNRPMVSGRPKSVNWMTKPSTPTAVSRPERVEDLRGGSPDETTPGAEPARPDGEDVGPFPSARCERDGMLGGHSGGAGEWEEFVESVDRVARAIPPVGVGPNEGHGELGARAADVDRRSRLLDRTRSSDRAAQREAVSGIVEAFSPEHEVEDLE